MYREFLMPLDKDSGNIEILINHEATDLTKRVDKLKNSLEKAEAVIIAAGSGFFSAAGLAYGNIDTFNALFPATVAATAPKPHCKTVQLSIYWLLR
jgi:hypothetical protein